jgi:hypothetical protein
VNVSCLMAAPIATAGAAGGSSSRIVSVAERRAPKLAPPVAAESVSVRVSSVSAASSSAMGTEIVFATASPAAKLTVVLTAL